MSEQAAAKVADGKIPDLAWRLGRQEGWAWLAQDNIEAVIERIIPIVGTYRLFTKLHRYVHQREKTGDWWALSYEAKMDMHLDHERVPYQDPVKRWSSDFHRQTGVSFACGPGAEGFGFSVAEEHMLWNREMSEPSGYVTDTEQQVWEYANTIDAQPDGVFNRKENVTFLRWQGDPGHPHRNDRILIQDWNSNGVCSETLIMFSEQYWRPDIQSSMAVELFGGYKDWEALYEWTRKALEIEERDYSDESQQKISDVMWAFRHLPTLIPTDLP